MNNLDKHLAAYEGDISYDFDNNILLNWYPKRILEQQENKELTLLELGLGHGYSTNIFSNYYLKHVVIDGSKSIINNFQKKYPNCKAKIVESFFEAFDTEEKFDLIVMGFVLEHVDEPIRILKYFQKYLKSGGVVYAAVPNAEVMNRRLGVISGLLSNVTELSENDYLLGHQRYYTQKSFSQDIHNAGYEILQMEGIYLKPLASSQMQKLELSNEILNALCVLGVNYPELSCGLLAKMKIK